MSEQVFVARENELAQLKEFLGRALAGHGQVCFVTGEAGSGKTALVTEFARRAQDAYPDLLVAIGDCNAQTGIGDPYLPFREVLGLLTGDVEAKLSQGVITQQNARRLRAFLRISGQALVELGPDLINVFVPGVGLATRAAAFAIGKVDWLDRLERLREDQAAGPGDTSATLSSDLAQSDIFEQYASVLSALAAERPLMLVVDDLQWADAASIGLLFHLSRRIGDSRILIVGAYRPDDVAMGRGGERHPLEPVLNEFKRYFGNVWVDLGEVEEAEGRQFVDALLDSEPNRLGEVFREALYRHTGGHALFTVELLRDMQERGDLVQDEAGRWVEGPALDWETLPARVEGVIEERIERLEEELRDILTVAAVEGEDFTAQVIARVEEIRERRLLRTLSRELEKRHRLVRERGETRAGRYLLSRYQFAHALFQQFLYNDLSAGERRLLHGEIAEVLEELYEGRTDEITVQLARHYAEAGEGEKAVEYLLQAGDRARGLYAYREAIDHYQRALAFLKEQAEYERAARTLMKLGLTYHIAFDFQRARQAYEEGFALWQRAGEAQPVVSATSAPHALRVAWSSPVTVDPTMAGDVESASVAEQLFCGLVEQTPELDIVPGVAQTWEIFDNGRGYIFHLRSDVRWSDGTPVTAHDFEYAWKRVLDPATESPNASKLFDVRGARAFHLGQVTDPDAVGVRAIDDITLVVELEGPTSYFPQLLVDPARYAVPRHVIETHGDAWTEPDNIVTNGPFRLEVWQPGESMVLVRNPEYHGRFGGNLQQVELSLLPEWSAALEAYDIDGLDVVDLWNFPPPEMDRVRQRHAGEYMSAPWLDTAYVGFDVSRPPFDDQRVRRAFVLATDRGTLANVVLRDYCFPATGGFVPPGMPGHSAGIGLPYDPEQARRLLSEAGYPAGRGFPAVELVTGNPGIAVKEYLLGQWRDNLGVEIAWETTDFGMLQERLEDAPPRMFTLAWVADYPDPDNFLRVCPARRYARWQHDTYEHLVEEAKRVTEQAERMKLYGQADRILIEEAPLLPLAHDRLHLLVKPWVRRYPVSPIRCWFWKDVIIEPH